MIRKTTINTVRVDVNSAPTNYNTPPLLCVHGMWGTSQSTFNNWLELAEKQKTEAYAINLRPRNGRASIKDYTEDLSEVIRGLGRRCVLVGHSLGALVSMAGSQDNHLVKSLVILQGATPKGLQFTAFKAFWVRYLLSAAFGNPFALTYSDAMRYVLNKVANPEELLSEFRPESGRVLRDILFGVKVYKERLPRRILVVGATHDRILPVAAQRAISHTYSTDYMEVPMGHMVPVEDEKGEVLRKVLDWSATRRTTRRVAVPA